jgi:hypothetical protein
MMAATITGTVQTAEAAAGDSSLSAGQELQAGQDLVSPGGQYTLAMQTDGNLVVYGNGCVIWASNTAGTGSSNYLAMQTDGNLVIYTSASKPVWASNTAGTGSGNNLNMQVDGNLVVYTSAAKPVWASGAGAADQLCATHSLGLDQYIHSSDGQYKLLMQDDGNLVLYGPNGATWASNTVGSGGTSVNMQGDGNLVIYTPSGSPVWSSNTAPSSNDRLVMQTDGNLVIYSQGGLPLWSSRGGLTGYSAFQLRAGQSLAAGQALWSTDGRYEAVMQTDGNFVEYGPSGVVWASASGVAGSHIVMQTDGNLVIYPPSGAAVWSSSTAPSSNDRLVVQTDGNLVIYSGSTALWAKGKLLTGPSPSWWSGSCDVGNHPGSHPLGASYNGVVACGPGPTQGGYDHLVHFYSGAWGEYEWECVELVMRYMYLVYGIHPYSANGSTVVSHYSGSALTKVSNNGSSLPRPGDIISEGAANTNGHTAVVTNVSVTNGKGTVTIMEQNATSTGWGSIAVTGNVLGSSVTAWLHH